MFTTYKDAAAQASGYLDYDDAYQETCRTKDIDPNSIWSKFGFGLGFWGTTVALLAAPLVVVYWLIKKIK